MIDPQKKADVGTPSPTSNASTPHAGTNNKIDVKNALSAELLDSSSPSNTASGGYFDGAKKVKCEYGRDEEEVRRLMEILDGYNLQLMQGPS